MHIHTYIYIHIHMHIDMYSKTSGDSNINQNRGCCQKEDGLSWIGNFSAPCFKQHLRWVFSWTNAGNSAIIRSQRFGGSAGSAGNGGLGMGVVQSYNPNMGLLRVVFLNGNPITSNSQKHGEPLGDSAVGWGKPTKQPGREAGMFAWRSVAQTDWGDDILKSQPPDAMNGSG